MPETFDLLDIELSPIDAPIPQQPISHFLCEREAECILFWLTRGRCWYCGVQLTPYTMTMDHVIPVSRNGEFNNWNCTPACNSCNSTKNARTPADFRQYLNRKHKLPYAMQIFFWGEINGLNLPLMRHFNPNDWRS